MSQHHPQAAPNPMPNPMAHRDLGEAYADVRQFSHSLAAPLSDADQTVQPMEDASPTKWHLAHTTWFFETFVLKPNVASYEEFNPDYSFLFNSYYEQAGPRQARNRRGLLTRPHKDEITHYRAHIDAAMKDYLAQELLDDAANLVTLGLHHEQQHQELLLTDILYTFAQSPIKPTYLPAQPVEMADAPSLNFIAFDGGIFDIGKDECLTDFSYDCEGPRHKVLVEDFALANRCVTNREFIRFIADGGYTNPLLWLSDGWAWIKSHHAHIDAPLYWEKREDTYWTMTLRGMQPVNLDAPVTHLSFFEADAFARWAAAQWEGVRLPTEAEWEIGAQSVPVSGNDAGRGVLRPLPAKQGDGLQQMFGDVWEWTRSTYSPYPGFKPAPGAVGEYNGKFMCGQFVLRGGSCTTSPGHMRLSYRNFFYPNQAWQFSGLRLGKSL